MHYICFSCKLTQTKFISDSMLCGYSKKRTHINYKLAEISRLSKIYWSIPLPAQFIQSPCVQWQMVGTPDIQNWNKTD